MRVLVLTTQVPFIQGGAEAHARGLVEACIAAGHSAETVAIPFKWYPPERIPEQILACRLLDITESSGHAVDRVIGLKFPAYCIPHPNKVAWILHQHRSAYDLWGGPMDDLSPYPEGQWVRDVIRNADVRYLSEAQALYANSNNVAQRLERFCGLQATPLYHPPPGAEGFYAGPYEAYLFYPSRINRTKRQHLVVEALAETQEPVQLRLAGLSDDPVYEAEVRGLIQRLKLGERITWLGPISEAEKQAQYAHALGVVFPPIDEDYGYITLEAMLSARAVITCTDSGGPLEFVQPQVTGLVSEPTPKALAAAMDRLWAERSRAQQMGEAGRDVYEQRQIHWPHVVEVLTQ